MKLIRDGGVHVVTLSAVCRLAEISKGGLVHHFPSKDSLIDAFLDRAARQYLELIDNHLVKIPVGQGRWAEALLDLFLRDHLAGDGSGANGDGGDDDQCTAVMLALIQSEGRGAIAKSLFDHVVKKLRADGLSMDLATTLLVAIDGFWFQSVIEAPEEVRLRASRLRRQLQKMLRSEVGQPSVKKPLRKVGR